MYPRVVLASDNQHKLQEFSRMLDGVCEIVPQARFNLSTPEENGHTFEENAILKARYACRVAEMPALADDSGIEVAALGGAPGIFSARYAGEHATATDNINKLIDACANLSDDERHARYYCAIAYIKPREEQPLVVSASWEGILLRYPSGDKGFGYDPVFYVPEQACTVAELDPEVKNTLSHRGKALARLRQLLELMDE